jgi:peptide/nickel transport system ATP-binding protein
MSDDVLLSVTDLGVTIGRVQPLDGVALQVDRGQVLGVVGESGVGQVAHRAGGDGPAAADRRACQPRQHPLRRHRACTTLAEPAYRALRGKRMALITQNPMTSLDPLRTVGWHRSTRWGGCTTA